MKVKSQFVITLGALGAHNLYPLFLTCFPRTHTSWHEALTSEHDHISAVVFNPRAVLDDQSTKQVSILIDFVQNSLLNLAGKNIHRAFSSKILLMLFDTLSF